MYREAMRTRYSIMMKDNKIYIGTECPMCGTINEVEVTYRELENLTTKHSEPKLIQELLPDMKPSDREKLITGLCDKCQDILFGWEE